MRLIHLADYGGPYPGSFVPMITAVLREAAARGWSVQAAFTAVAGERAWLADLEAAGIPVRLAPAGSRADIARFVSSLVDEADGATVLHTHFTAFDLPAAAVSRRRNDVVAFWHLHSALVSGPRWWLRGAAKFGLLSGGVSQILCVASNIAEQARRRFAPAARVVVLPNAIDLVRFPLVTDAQRAQARAQLSIPADAVVLLHFGWDWDRKGGDVFLHALRELESPPRSTLLALTVGAEAQARALADSLGLADAVRALPATPDVQRLYAAADVFVAPSRAEGHPFAVAEALASGLPVVASRIPGHEMIARHAAACHIAGEGADALAAALREALAEPEAERARERLEARRWLAAELDIEPWAQRMIERYQAVLDDGTTATSQ